MITRMHFTRAASLVAVLVTAPTAGAQMRVARARTLGMGETQTAIARGIDAIVANPAGLAMPGSGGFSFTLLPGIGGEGAAPVTMGDVQRFEGRVIDDATKRLWAARVRQAGAEHVDASGDVTW